MFLRCIAVVSALVAAMPAFAGELRPDEAKRFIAGKYFAYHCFDGTTGAGRINADGSVLGTLQTSGAPQPRLVALPPGTLRVQSDSICASLRGLPFQPCFSINKTDERSFRGTVSTLGMGFAYCDFTRRNPRLEIANSAPPLRRQGARQLGAEPQ
jgi:hypothetical protein